METMPENCLRTQTAYIVARGIYNIFLHPLRSYPGPLLGCATIIACQQQILRGYNYRWLQKLHQTYGPVVRCSPNVLSFIKPEIWKDVYGYKTPSFAKDLTVLGLGAHGDPPGMLRADDGNHARQRRLFSNAFGDKALKSQEELLKGHTRTLIAKLFHIANGKRGCKTDITKWYNFTTLT